MRAAFLHLSANRGWRGFPGVADATLRTRATALVQIGQRIAWNKVTPGLLRLMSRTGIVQRCEKRQGSPREAACRGQQLERRFRCFRAQGDNSTCRIAKV